MKYDNRRAFEKHLESAGPAHFAPLYMILGQDGYEVKEAVQTLIQSLLPSSTSLDLGLSIKEGSRLTRDELLTDVNSISFFSDKRILWIQQADKLKKEVAESLETYFTQPQSSLYLILTAPTLSKNSSFYKKGEKEGVVLEIPELKAWEKEKRLVEWVAKQASNARKLMPYPVCQALVKQIGFDQELLQQELDKLFCYIDEKKEITLQDVEAICTQGSSETIWQCGEAIFRRDARSAWRMSQALIAESTSLLPLLRQIRSQFQTGYQICLILSQGGQASQVAQEFPFLKGQLLERQIEMAQHYGLENYKQGLLTLDATEMQVKNSQVNENLLMEMLIFKLTQ